MVIMDSVMPVFIPFGYRGIGKTALTLRLIQYFFNIGYSISPDMIFRNDPDYPRVVEEYMRGGIPRGMPPDRSILINVINNGFPVCYLLDMDGSHLCNLNLHQTTISPDLNYIAHTPNPKIWGFFVDVSPSAPGFRERRRYVQTIHEIAPFLSKRDKIIFILSKIDSVKIGSVSEAMPMEQLIQRVEAQYPQIFDPFVKKYPIFKFLKRKNYSILPFSAGVFRKEMNSHGEEVQYYTPGSDVYPKLLWKEIIR